MGLLTDTKINSNLTTVPEAVRNYLSLQSGDRIEWYVENADVVVRRKETAPSVADHGSPEEEEAVDEAVPKEGR